jgi:hypothetical protein
MVLVSGEIRLVEATLWWRWCKGALWSRERDVNR